MRVASSPLLIHEIDFSQRYLYTPHPSPSVKAVRSKRQPKLMRMPMSQVLTQAYS